MKRVGLIGCGAIGRPVARALLAGKAGSHSLAAVLARAPRDLDGFPVTDAADRFLAGGHDLIIEAGGPAAFRALVPAALHCLRAFLDETRLATWPVCAAVVLLQLLFWSGQRFAEIDEDVQALQAPSHGGSDAIERGKRTRRDAQRVSSGR